MSLSKLNLDRHVTKKYMPQLLQKLLFLVIVFLCIGILAKNKLVPQKKVLSVSNVPISVGLPVRLIIPSINVNTVIQNVGITESGEMGIPTNSTDVGWFDLGPRPGGRGSAVIAGHFDSIDGSTGVFTDLDKLVKGDSLYIEDNKGNTTTFMVRDVRNFDPGYAEEIFNLSDSSHLNLITCSGTWNGNRKSYSKRLVVFSDLIKQ